MNDGDYLAATCPRRLRERQVRRDLERGENRKQHGVTTAFGDSPSGLPPAVWPVPREVPLGVGKQFNLRLVNGQLTRIEPLRILASPRHERYLVPGSRQPVREHGGVLGRAALVWVSRSDDGDSHGVTVAELVRSLGRSSGGLAPRRIRPAGELGEVRQQPLFGGSNSPLTDG